MRNCTGAREAAQAWISCTGTWQGPDPDMLLP